jgi:Spy/CpxP family protein refolding chaperone
MKKILFTFLALTSATQLFAQTASPTPSEQESTGVQSAEERWHDKLFERLDLAADQKERINQIREADRENLREAWARVKIAGESLKAALLANPENTADVQAKATDLANTVSTSTTQTALHLAKITGCGERIVGGELSVIAWIRKRFINTPLLRALIQAVIGAILVFLTGILLGSLG